ncbi:hypothetical protein K440DRAFT_641527 [Wilcoxina mikolae CBS 423.85]|nr:hypothetical protein K440DRAFT_641527 [Wilcoxina mikolae CBS 423.85]
MAVDVSQKKPSKESIVEKWATLKRSAIGLDIHTDPTTWWVYEDEYLRNEMDWFDLYNESEKKKYTSGEYDQEMWSSVQRKIMRWKADTQERINGILGLKYDILRKIHENGVEGPGYPLMSRSYADLITEFYETRGSRKTSDQQNFRTACINVYGSSRNQEGQVEIWDCVLREYVDPDLMTAAHITPFFIGKIIPTLDSRVLTFGDIDGTELVFQTSHRPKARYLYFHYVVALLRTRRHKRKGWLQQQTQREIAWATPGRYLRETMLRTLIAAVGHDAPVLPPEIDITEEVEAFSGHMEDDEDGKDAAVRG